VYKRADITKKDSISLSL